MTSRTPPAPSLQPVDGRVALSKLRHDRTRFSISSIPWLLPAGALLGVLFLFPVGYAVYLGLTNIQLLGPHAATYNFTGTANIARMIHDDVFKRSLKLTFFFVVGSGIVAQTILGIILALAMQKALPFVRLSVGAVVIIAWVLPEISAAFVWVAFSEAHGTFGQIFGHANHDWLATNALLVVSTANAWRNTAFSMLIFSASLRNVPHEVNEAAELEGAHYWRRLRSVVLPIIRPTIFTCLLLITLATISDFTLIFAMTQGGPGNDTSILPVYMYLEAFQFNELGYGSAIACALVVLGAVFSLLYVRQLRPEGARRHV